MLFEILSCKCSLLYGTLSFNGLAAWKTELYIFDDIYDIYREANNIPDMPPNFTAGDQLVISANETMATQNQ